MFRAVEDEEDRLSLSNTHRCESASVEGGGGKSRGFWSSRRYTSFRSLVSQREDLHEQLDGIAILCKRFTRGGRRA